jgi:hypothetical protein
MRSNTYLNDPSFILYTPELSVQEAQRITTQRQHDTLLDVARCPRCDRPMHVRMGRRGPYFQCGCPNGNGQG